MKAQLERERYRLLHSFVSLMEGPMIFLGFAWLILLVVELTRGLPPMLEQVTLIIWIIFIVDFLLKLFIAPRKISYLKKNWLTAVSLAIPALRMFRMIRIIRVLRGLRGIRLIRVVSSINRGMRGLTSTMSRRGFTYVFMLTLLVTFGGAAGMYALERPNPGFENFALSLWWTAMRIITAGSEHWPTTPEGRGLAFILALYGYGVFGYVTAVLATFFIGRDAEEKDAPVAGAAEVEALRQEIIRLQQLVAAQKSE